ncbi:MAG TPA: hypothetical protein VGR00_06920 [Thermoanaerobaculia bacterium]|jgi:hypothetical protein|nr:hypothetical protein [Thermoanaerobaculia bacterium]
MPKIPPRPEIVSHPLYQATMAAQHAAYKIARELPPDRKAEGARVHVACVHATTWATYALEPGAPDRAAALDNVRASAEEARRKLEPVAAAAADENDVEALTKALGEIEKTLAEVRSPAA